MIKSENYKILRNLIRKDRTLRREYDEEEISYLILYSFLYKYLSDNFKKFLSSQIPDFKFSSLEEYYSSPECCKTLKQNSLKQLGYFINSPEALIDSVVDAEYTGNYYASKFFSILNEHIEFNEGSCQEKDFKTIIEILNNSNINNLDYNSKRESVITEYIRFITKLNIYDEVFTFQQVYDIISSSRFVNASHTNHYIINILTKLVLSQKHEFQNIYNPFMGDASLLLEFKNNAGKFYGSDENQLNYFYSLINLIINDFKSEDVVLTKSSVNDMNLDDELFDVILSKIPYTRFPKTPERLSQKSLSKPDNTKDLKEDLLSKFSNSDLKKDKNVMDALNVLIKEVEASSKNEDFNFPEEYKSLKNNEFLFLIKLLNSLKQDGMMVISISRSFLFIKSLSLLRKYLIKEINCIDTIISIPEELGRSRPEIIIVFKKNRKDDNILFVDVSRKYKTKRSPNSVPGLFRRNLILDDGCLDKIIEICSQRKSVKRFSELVELSKIHDKGFNLSVSRYVDTYEGDFVVLTDLKKEKEEINFNINVLNQKIDKLMDELNIKF